MNHTVIKYLILSASLAAVTGCVPHLTQQQCQTMNWFQVGYSDASQGNFQRNLNSAINDCSKFKLSVDTNSYRRGWNQGARAYCKTSTAYQLGVNGTNYNHICPSDLANAFDRSWRRGLRRYCVPDTGYNLGRQGTAFPNFCAPDQINRFRNAYNDGYHIYSAIQNIDSQTDSINSQIDDLNGQIQDSQNKINDLNTMLGTLNPDVHTWVNPPNPQDLRNQIQNLNYHIMQIRNQISSLQAQRTSLQQQANDYNAE